MNISKNNNNNKFVTCWTAYMRKRSKINFQSSWKFVKMTHHNTKLQLGGHKNIYKNIYADTTSKFASIRLLARWSGSVYKLMIHHWLLWFFVYVMIRYIVTRGTSILGEVRNVEIPGATQQLLNALRPESSENIPILFQVSDLCF